MEERNLSEELGLGKSLWGGIFQLDIRGKEVAARENHIALIDQQCRKKQLLPIGDAWREIDYPLGHYMLKNLLRLDLAYPSCEFMSVEQAESLCQVVLTSFVTQPPFCYSNWQGEPEPWGSGGWMPITEHTFDAAVVFINTETLVFAYRISED